MKPIIIREGQIWLKKNGVLYELDNRIFNKAKAILFDSDSPLCKHCGNRECRETRRIESEYITDALTLKGRKTCQYVFSCKNYTVKKPTYFEESILIYLPETSNGNSAEEIAKHYGDAFSAHIAHPTVKSKIHTLKF